MDSIHQARLAQSVEHQTLNRRVVGSSPTVDKKFFILYFVASDALLAGRLAPCKWNQAWRPSELYMCIEREREKVDFKSREVNCLKECALALTYCVKYMFCLYIEAYVYIRIKELTYCVTFHKIKNKTTHVIWHAHEKVLIVRLWCLC